MMKYPIFKKYHYMGNPTILRGTVVPVHTAPHNIESWARIEPFVDEELTLEELTAKLGSHGGPAPNARTFILYCCDLKWLKIKRVAC